MNNTIFDDVFRTMIEKMPYLAVPLINEVFHTSYPEDVKITQLRNEHQQEDGEIITDLTKLFVKIADYIFREEDEVRKGLVYCIIDISLNNLPVFPSNCVDFAQRCHRIASFSRLVDEKTFCVI